jgi:hypothetical protein
LHRVFVVARVNRLVDVAGSKQVSFDPGPVFDGLFELLGDVDAGGKLEADRLRGLSR